MNPGTPPPTLRWLRSQQLVAAALLLALALGALAAAFIAFEWRALEETQLARAELFARSLENQTASAVSGTDTILRSLLPALAQRQQPEPKADVTALLQDSLRGRPFLRSVSWLDGEGRVLASSNPGNVGYQVPLALLGQPEAAGRGAWLAPLASGRDLDGLGQAPLAQATVLALPLVVAFNAPQGPALLVGLINPDHFSTQFERTLSDSPLRALLLGLDGRVIVGTSGVAIEPGTPLPALPAFSRHLPAREFASDVGIGSDGGHVLSAFRATRDWPLVVLVEQPQSVLQEELFVIASWTLAFLLTSWALLAAGTWTVRRSLTGDERRGRELATALAATRASESRKQAVMQSSLDAIVTVGADGRVLEFNAAAERMFGHVTANVLGQPMRELIVPMHHRAAHQAGMARYQSSGVTRVLNRRIEVEALHADGHLFPVELTIVPVQTGSGEIFTATLRDITERQRVEQALRDSEARAQATFEQAAVGVLQQDFDGRLLRVNQTLCDMLGYPRDDLLALRVEDIVHPADFAAAAEGMRALIASKTNNLVSDRRYRRSDGSFVWARLTLSMARNSDGQPLYLIGIVEDITARRQAELDLHESRALLDKTGRIGGIGGWTLELGQPVARWTDQTAIIHDRPPGYQPQSLEEAIGYYAPEAAERMAQAVQRAIANGDGFDLELPLITAQGRRIWVRAVGRAEYESGQPVRMVGAFQDITERRQAQDELAQARERELTIGSRIQQTLLVDAPDQRLPGLWLSTLSQASQRIDGDFIELISLGDHGVDIIVGDVMGKGVAAALMAAATKMQFSRCVAELVSSPVEASALPTPAEVIAAVHRAMTSKLQELEAFVTLSYLRIDTRAGLVTWVGCGSEEPVLLRADGSMQGLANQHPPMGVLSETQFQQQSLPFLPGDALFMCSDGAADALLPDGSRLGHARVMAMLQGLLGQLSTPAAVLHALRGELARTGARFTDDLTLALAISAGDTALASRRELSAGLGDLPHVRGLVEVRCRQAGLDEVTASLFTLACVEAYTNAVRHTVGRPAGTPVELVVRTEPQRLVVEIVTLGEAFTPEPSTRETDFADFPEGGFGLNIMAQATDSVEHHHALGVNTVRLTHHRPTA